MNLVGKYTLSCEAVACLIHGTVDRVCTYVPKSKDSDSER